MPVLKTYKVSLRTPKRVRPVKRRTVTVKARNEREAGRKARQQNKMVVEQVLWQGR